MVESSVTDVSILIQRLRKWKNRRRKIGLRTKELQEAEKYLMEYAKSLLRDRAKLRPHWNLGVSFRWCKDCCHSCFHECCCVCGGHLG